MDEGIFVKKYGDLYCFVRNFVVSFKKKIKGIPDENI